jgi:putative ABC transport system ATP-binding protein
MAILKTSELKKIYPQGENSVHALDGVDIAIEEGEFIAIVGSSGSGKSTLLNMLGGLDYPTSGAVYINETDLNSLKNDNLTIFRRRNIGFVFQNYNLMPILNVYENIVLPLKLDGIKIDETFISAVVKTLKIEEKLFQMPNTLSGGQQQRVAIARALAAKPAVILADEPTGNLDSVTSTEVIGLLKMSAYEYNQTIVIVTHNEEIAQMADRIIRIEDGRVSFFGQAKEQPGGRNDGTKK